ncbi:uncharacterized protein LOC122038757 isoform X1 [Zingiber officinale]|uniref:uncharacterized protein LOC122038757 isoform X1 n=1 Tax=Zingiber officinale TaxID=94328 RepID=UPI001C4DBF00|nr:uncharacterized protein LOC122038757 isoform X1 [Zingiber officinale]
MAASPAEIVRVFAKIASRVQGFKGEGAAGNNDDEGFAETTAAISSLSASLGYDDDSGLRVLNAALSLMCFRDSELHRVRIECLVDSMISMLSSSVSCKVLRALGSNDEEFLGIGTSFSTRDCVSLIQVCADVLNCLSGHCGAGDSHALLYATIKAVTSSSICQNLLPSSSIGSLEEKDLYFDLQTELSKLICNLSNETPNVGNKSQMRLLFWYLDPMILKQDISEILQECVRRPFLCLKKELHDRVSWRNVIICLVTSSTVFLETRSMLHTWFLSTGLASSLDLKVRIVASVLDILSRPMWWQLPADVGLKLPCSYAYFSNRHHELLAILTGQLSCKSFLHLVCYIKAIVASLLTSENSCSHGNFVDLVGCNSAWAVLLDFPVWFHFAIALIFLKSRCEAHLPSSLHSILRTETVNHVELHDAAIYFIAWILDPADIARDILVKGIDELSESYILKHDLKSAKEERADTDIRFKNVLCRTKKLKIPNVSNIPKRHLTFQSISSLDIQAWLENFNVILVRLCSKITNSDVEAVLTSKDGQTMKPNLLFARVPIGLLFVSPNCLDERGCEMLLQYAATGKTMKSKEIRKCAIRGARMVFDLLETIEDMSVMLFDGEDDRIDFVSQMKQKTGTYLIHCIRMLLKPEEQQIDAVATGEMKLDLHHRLLEWKQQGRQVFEGHEEFDDFMDQFSKRFQFSHYIEECF